MQTRIPATASPIFLFTLKSFSVFQYHFHDIWFTITSEIYHITEKYPKQILTDLALTGKSHTTFPYKTGTLKKGMGLFIKPRGTAFEVLLPLTMPGQPSF